MHRTTATVAHCACCGEAVGEARGGWWIVSHTREAGPLTFCSSSCAAFFEEREQVEVTARDGVHALR